jgi:GWxTD domain-containing protein
MNEKAKTINRQFDVVWFEKPVYMYKYDLAIRPMQYIMDSTDIEKTDELNSSELKEWYQQFWKEKDPTQSTPYNEVQHEFYQRVDRANRKFNTRFNEGWESDFGKYLILYGEPDKTERKLHTDNKTATEIWLYKSLNKKLIFTGDTSSNLFEMTSIEKIEE